MPATGENIHNIRLLKLTIKLLVLVLVWLGVCSLMPSAKIYADATNNFRCPNGTGQPGMQDASSNLHWGVPYQENGGDGGNMGGLLIQAYDAGNNNQLIDTHYHLNSGISTNDPYPITLDNGSQVNGNDRIFQDNNGTLSNRTNSYQSNTNDWLSNANGSTHCTGWDAFGPHGDSTMIGNGMVLDCDNGGPTSEFWFSSLANPTGVIDQDKQGYWEIQAYDPHTGSTIDVSHYTEGSMSFGKNAFTITNGVNAYVYLIWHPTYQAPTPSSDNGKNTCQYLSVTETAGSSLTRTHVTATGMSIGRMVYTDNNNNNTYSPGPDWTEHYPDDGSHNAIAAWIGPGDDGKSEDGDTNKTLSKTWYFQPYQNSITVSYYTQTEQNLGTAKNPNWQWVTISSTGPTTTNCFQASVGCSMTITGDGPMYNGSNVVATPGQIYISGTYTNTGQLPIYNPALADQGGNIYPTGVGEVDPGGSVPFNIQIGAPNGIQNFSFSLTAVYLGSPPGAISNTCYESVPVYQQFVITPAVPAIASGTNPENPYESGISPPTHGITYTVGGSLTQGTTTSAVTTGSLTKNGVQVDSHNPTDSYGVGISHTYNYADSNFQAGDQYCVHVTIYPATGWHGPSGDLPGYDASASMDGASCLTITNEPYFKTTNGSISARAGVTPSAATCPANTNNSGLLAGWNDNADFSTDRGSSSELSNLALIKITGVASAQTSPSRSPTDLTFANNNAPDPRDVASPGMGGNFGGSPSCDPAPVINATSTLGGTAGVPAAGGSYQTTGGMTLTGGTVSSTAATSIHVNGDLYITGNITYGPTNNPSWTDDEGNYVGPSLVIVATGNIYIAPGVTQLDGVYIAQPTDATHGGTIYTCSPNGGPPASYDFYNKCRNQLLVTGSFKASNVKLLRTFGSLRNEEPVGGAIPPTPACSNAGARSPASPTNTCAAEVFRLSPEMYLTPPATGWPNNGATQYDAITSLPPVL